MPFDRYKDKFNIIAKISAMNFTTLEPQKINKYLVWVPVGVEYDDGVCCLQIQPQSPRTGGEDKNEAVVGGVTELGQHVSSVFRLRSSVQSQVSVV